MAVLISKVVRSSRNDRPGNAYSSSNNVSGRRTHHASVIAPNHRDSMFPGAMKMNTHVSGRTMNEDDEHEYEHQGPGIMMKTVITTVRTDDADGSTSTEELVANPKRLTR
jgi:hypothetical protein